MSARDYRDDLLSDMFDREAILLERLTAAESRADFAEQHAETYASGYRLVAYEAIAVGSRLHLELDELKVLYRRSIDEARGLREALLMREGIAA